MSRAGWDLTSKRSLESGAEWIRKGSGALLVLVVRAEDVVFALSPDLAPKDAAGMVELVLPGAMEQVQAARLEERAKRKLKAVGIS